MVRLELLRFGGARRFIIYRGSQSFIIGPRVLLLLSAEVEVADGGGVVVEQLQGQVKLLFQGLDFSDQLINQLVLDLKLLLHALKLLLEFLVLRHRFYQLLLQVLHKLDVLDRLLIRDALLSLERQLRGLLLFLLLDEPVNLVAFEVFLELHEFFLRFLEPLVQLSQLLHVYLVK